jgi:hypothetical protein
VLAVYHEQSSVTDVLSTTARAPSVNLVTYSDTIRAESRVAMLCERMATMIERPVWQSTDVDLGRLGEYFADRIAGQFAEVFDRVVRSRAA